jgi:hypothetical protein
VEGRVTRCGRIEIAEFCGEKNRSEMAIGHVILASEDMEMKRECTAHCTGRSTYGHW